MSRLNVLDHLAPLENRGFSASEAGHEAVQQQLDRILAHPFFKHSKRYPVLLRYIVEQTLRGDSQLKERTLGVEVFGRDPGYDTNEDPVVRITAGEIRKRIAQYYYEPGHESELRIELPPGSYVPEFHLPGTAPGGQETGASTAAAEPRPGKLSKKRIVIYLAAALGLAAAITGAARVRPWTSAKPLDDFWNPVLRAGSEPLVCIGEPSSLSQGGQEHVGPSVSDYIYGPDHIAFSDASALFHLAEFLGSRGTSSRLQAASATTLTDLRQGPVVLVAGFDNEWTVRIAQSLRYRFESTLGPGPRIAWVEDRLNPSRRDWTVDFGQKYSQLSQDYAIVSRFSDPTTGQPVVIAAGLGENGTIAAGEFLTDADEMLGATKSAPRDWRRGNIEVVLATQVIDGKSGPPRVLATYFWQSH